ncbi:low affinity immunoglobulin epsilon Fc receptor-like [Entelurus aequoreus]|uniref:low affinity immunoglobulin epsilon Fc receptor-like n=1 Tax=Entelurus aequoreus TaxID=161455 RepID=UPI002B1E6761|nr:low affinity immunoglobulin epsilon Fc receptor-like [Entelurus aequoreus]
MFFSSLQANGKYIYQKGPETFKEAKDICINKFGANLVSIHNDLEHKEVLQVIRSNNGGAIVDTWIGLDDIIQEGSFVWSAGTPYVPSAFSSFAVKGNIKSKDYVYIGTGGMGCASKGSVQRPFVCA